MIEYLWFSPLAYALTMSKSIPLVHLFKVYSFATYIQVDGIITFEGSTNTTSINKARFCRMLGLDSSEGLIDLDSISSTDLINMFYQMGYIGDSPCSILGSPIFLQCGTDCSRCCSRAFRNTFPALIVQVCSCLLLSMAFTMD